MAIYYIQDIAIQQSITYDFLYEKILSPTHRFIDFAFSNLLTSSAISDTFADDLLKSIISLFVVVNPIGKVPLFITLTEKMERQNILYKDEFDKWATQNQNLKIVYTITEEEKVKEQEGYRSIHATNSATEIKGNWERERGRIDRTMIERHFSKEEIDNAIFYICGPPGMINAIQEGLLQKQFQIPEERIKVEEFSGY